MRNRGWYEVAEAVVGDPAALVEVQDAREQLAALAPMLLAMACFGAALFGVAVGGFRGGWQLVFAGIKMPLVFLIPAVVTWPALRILLARDGEPVSSARAGLAALVGLARAGALCTALAPLVWLAFGVGLDYRIAVLVMCGALVTAGTPGLVTIARSLAAGTPRITTVALTVLLVGGVLAQTGWMLRPFVVAPEARLTLLCPMSKNIFTGLAARLLADDAVYQGANPSDCASPDGSWSALRSPASMCCSA